MCVYEYSYFISIGENRVHTAFLHVQIIKISVGFRGWEKHWLIIIFFLLFKWCSCLATSRKYDHKHLVLFAEAAAQGPARWLGWLKALVFHPGKLNLISGVHVNKEGRTYSIKLLSPLHMSAVVSVSCPPHHIHIHTIKIKCSGSSLSILLLGFVFTTLRTPNELLATVPLK